MATNSDPITLDRLHGQVVVSAKTLFVEQSPNSITSRIRYFFELVNGTWFELQYHSPWAPCFLIDHVGPEILSKARDDPGLQEFFGMEITDLVKSEYWATFGIVLNDTIVLNIEDDATWTERLFVTTKDADDLPDDLIRWVTGLKVSKQS